MWVFPPRGFWRVGKTAGWIPGPLGCIPDGVPSALRRGLSLVLCIVVYCLCDAYYMSLDLNNITKKTTWTWTWGKWITGKIVPQNSLIGCHVAVKTLLQLTDDKKCIRHAIIWGFRVRKSKDFQSKRLETTYSVAARLVGPQGGNTQNVGSVRSLSDTNTQTRSIIQLWAWLLGRINDKKACTDFFYICSKKPVDELMPKVVQTSRTAVCMREEPQESATKDNGILLGVELPAESAPSPSPHSRG